VLKVRKVLKDRLVVLDPLVLKVALVQLVFKVHKDLLV
jgi:hypothetical protein